MKRGKKRKKIVYWLSVIVVGIVLGITIQFVRAWTEPTQAPPGGNVGVPLNTSALDQTKGNTTSGKIQAKDFCLNSNPERCLSNVSNTISTDPNYPCECRTIWYHTGQVSVYSSDAKKLWSWLV